MKSHVVGTVELILFCYFPFSLVFVTFLLFAFKELRPSHKPKTIAATLNYFLPLDGVDFRGPTAAKLKLIGVKSSSKSCSSVSRRDLFHAIHWFCPSIFRRDAINLVFWLLLACSKIRWKSIASTELLLEANSLMTILPEEFTLLKSRLGESSLASLSLYVLSFASLVSIVRRKAFW